MSDYIKEGDKVNVYWADGIPAEFNLNVVSLPEFPGDWYGCKREDGTIVQVAGYAKMEQIKEANHGGVRIEAD
jgi:hypothetical protein